MDEMIMRALKPLPMFRDLDDEGLKFVAIRCRWRDYPAGETLFRQSDPGHSMYIILSGTVNILAHGRRGVRIPIAVRGAGEQIGELSLIDSRPRMADAITMEPTQLLILMSDDFEECLLRIPKLARSVLGTLANRLREAADQRANDYGIPATGRVAQLLSDIHSARKLEGLEPAEAAKIRLGQQEIADLIGATRETVNRTLSSMRELGAIRKDGHALVITDDKRLRKLAEPWDRRR